MTSSMILFYSKEDTLTIFIDTIIRSVSGMGVQKGGGTWRTVSVPDDTYGGQGYSYCHQ